MTISAAIDWGSTLGVIAAFGAGIIALLALRQQKAQLGASHKPHLILEEAWARINGVDGNGDTIHWRERPSLVPIYIRLSIHGRTSEGRSRELRGSAHNCRRPSN